jgi:hypothetical protein
LSEAGAILLPTEPDFSGATPTLLFERVVDYIRHWFKGPNELIFITALYAILTWRIHELHEVIYLRILGPWGSGKTQWLKIASQCCHRAIDISCNISPPALYRTLEQLPRATFALDEASLAGKMEDEYLQILRVGNTYPGFVLRADPAGVGQAHETKAFPCFGPKLIAAERPFPDDALESRILHFSVGRQVLPAEMNYTEPPELRAQGQLIRNQLLAYRITTYAQGQELRDRMRDAQRRLREMNLTSRVIQLGAALLALAGTLSIPDVVRACEDALCDLNDQITRSHAASKDGVIEDALDKLRGEEIVTVALSKVHGQICQLWQEQGLSHLGSDGRPREPISRQHLSRRLGKEGGRFRVKVDHRLNGKDQTQVRLLPKLG